MVVVTCFEWSGNQSAAAVVPVLLLLLQKKTEKN
jgi:hypothetical protein